MRILLLFVAGIFLLSQVSCKKYVPADEAFFIKPGLISVATTSAQGTGNNKITDLWVYVDGSFKGVYPVENTIPIVTKGKSVSIDIFAGIKNNGIKDTRISWPFYESIKLDTTVESGKTIVRPFTFRYRAATNFTWTENFEGQGYSIVKSADSEVGFEVVSGSEGIEGRYFHMVGTSTANILHVESAGAGFGLPQSDANVYLELNYKCNDDLTIGLLTSSGQEKEVFHLNPQASWNKTYIALAAVVNQSPTSSKHNIYFRMYKKEGGVVPEFFLDNIKLVYL